MTNYEIKEIDIFDESSRIAVYELMNEVYNFSVDKVKIYVNSFTKNRKTACVGAYLNGELVAFNIFLAHELMYNNHNVIAYQMYCSATSILHRKKGLISMLVNKAKRILDGAFIFAFPESNYEPILLKKLEFRKIDLNKVDIPVKYFSNAIFKLYLKKIKPNYQFSVKDCFLTLESELIELKKSEYNDEIKVYGLYNNVIWGKVVKRHTKFGASLFFKIGGIQINKPYLLPLLFQHIVKQEKIDVMQIIASSNSSLWDVFRFKKPANKTEPLTVYDLNIDTSNSRFNFTTGIKKDF